MAQFLLSTPLIVFDALQNIILHFVIPIKLVINCTIVEISNESKDFHQKSEACYQH